MAGSVPDWLTADFLKSCLLTGEEVPKDVAIVSYTTDAAVPPGNNYGSLMLRVKIQIKGTHSNSKERSISLIIKAPLTGGFMEEFAEFLKDIYEKEPKFYREFIKETYKLIKHDFVPKSYISPNPLCVVLEDLKASGYVMADKHKLLGLEEVQFYIKASSTLHALSVAVHKKNPELIESFAKESPMFVEKSLQTSKHMLLSGLRCMAAFLEDKPDYKDCLDVINYSLENEKIWEIYQEMESRDEPIRALIQTDPWCTNMMFKYNSSGKLENVKLFDFQALKFTNPVREFITFMWVSARLEVRAEKLHDLYHLYCDSFNARLAELGCSERLSFEALKAEVTSLSPLILVVISMMLPICVCDEAADIGVLLAPSPPDVPVKKTPVYQLYNGKTFNSLFPQIIDQVKREGLFDYLKEKLKLQKS